MCFFSIIIPMYNAESVIDRCLRSIKNQTYQNYEVLIINDGSTDKSSERCEQYISETPSWKLITQNNSGPSKARNTGLELAKGDYICFVDSDDWLEQVYLETLQEHIVPKKTDAVFFGYEKIIEGQIPHLYIPEIDICYKKEDICLQLSEKELFGYTWVKCFSAGAIGKIRYRENLNLLEDEVFTCEVMKNCSNISIIPKAIYHYISGNPKALIRRTHSDYCQIMNQAYLAWKDMLGSDYEKQLIRKADVFTSVCIYYGLERDVNVKSYFDDLRKTDFFRDHRKVNDLDALISAGQYQKIAFRRSLYIAKQALYQKLHRS